MSVAGTDWNIVANVGSRVMASNKRSADNRTISFKRFLAVYAKKKLQFLFELRVAIM